MRTETPSDVEAADLPSEEEVNRILQIEDKNRSFSEKMMLFNWLMEVGSNRAEQVEKHDVVLVIGDTGAGKSTFVDYLLGCTMKRSDDGQKIVVAEDSPIKEYAKIGLSDISATLVPNIIPATNGQPSREEANALLYIDSPGLSDNRGIEVALANAIVMNKCIGKAKSVRLVLLFESGMLSIRRGEEWRNMLDLVTRKFGIACGQNSNSLTVITKAPHETDVNKRASSHAQQGLQSGLLNSTIPYDPLDPESRTSVLDRIVQLHAHEKLANKIEMDDEQLRKVSKLGVEANEEIQKFLANGSSESIKSALKIVRFSNGIRLLGNPELNSIHDEVGRAVTEHVQTFVDKINPMKNSVLSKQVEAYHQFLFLKRSFGEFFPQEFAKIDDDIASMRKSTNDPRWVAMDKPLGVLTSGAATIATMMTVGSFFWPLAIVPGVLGSGVVAANLKRMLLPTKEEKKIDKFFQGL